MEITRGLRKYWRRSSYQRLDSANSNSRIIRLGGKKKRSWRIKAIPKLKLSFKIASPIKIWRKLRDSYINMMIGLEGKVGALNSDNFFNAKRIAPNPKGSSKDSKADEFEAKLVFEIYKSLIASRELAVPH